MEAGKLGTGPEGVLEKSRRSVLPMFQCQEFSLAAVTNCHRLVGSGLRRSEV